MFLEDNHPIFGMTNNTTDDKLSFISNDFTYGTNKDKKKEETDTNDQSLQEHIINQKYTLMNKQRRKYWGEPKDCSSNKQIQKDNFTYRCYLNKQYLASKGANESVFKIERVLPSQ